MFEQSDYQALVDKINAVRRLGLNHVLSVPQIAIVGDQSTGKSSVLEAVTKLSFPRDKNMCTRFATQVTLRRDPQVTGADRLSAHIEGEEAFNLKFGEVESVTMVETVIKEAVAVLCKTSHISDKVLELTLTGPTQSPLTIIDLPGYINTTIDGQDPKLPEKIRAINARYIEDPRTIILAVHPANYDLNNSTALGKAGEVDPNGERTIPIITRPDEVAQGLLEDVVDMVLNNRKKMRHGYLVMRNASYMELGCSWEHARDLEATYFRETTLWDRVSSNVKGRESVKAFLGALLYDHIKKELPLLKKEIVEMTEKNEEELKKMGHQVATTSAARVEFILTATRLRDGLNELLEGHYSQSYIDAFKDTPNGAAITGTEAENSRSRNKIKEKSLDVRFVRSTLNQLYRSLDNSLLRDIRLPNTEEISVLMQRYNGNELPGFLPFRVFQQVFNETLLGWKRSAKVQLEKTCDYFRKAVMAYIAYAITDVGMQPLFQDVFDRFHREQKKKVEEQVQIIFEDEAHPFTFNRDYFEKILKNRDEKSSKRAKNKGGDGNGNGDDSDRSTVDYDDYVNNYDTSTTPSRFASHGHGSPRGYQQQLALQPQEQTNEQAAAEDLQEMLKAYCDIARKRIVDVLIMQTVERNLTRQIDTYFAQLVAVEDKALQSLIESPMKQEARRTLAAKIDTLTMSLREL
ncbi:hypothetical protein DFQ26_003605 [Actinomortierella ambigua]|nr:hypothetical protein DFQ26_003605 [Actinomortierella ambigua]